MAAAAVDATSAAASASMRAAVRRLSFGLAAEERRDAAAEVARLARADERTKRLLPGLGVVPPLIDMLVQTDAAAGARVAAAGALLELARGTHRNKVHIVKAGLLKKLPQLTNDKDLSSTQELALLLLSISSLTSTDFPVPTTELLPFLVSTLNSAAVPSATKLPLLAALRNLSTKLEHARAVVTSGAVRALLSLSVSPDTKTAAAALRILGEMAATSAAARTAMMEDGGDGEAAARAVLEAMTRHGEESARCQEHATYLAMVLAHRGGGAIRRRMRRLGAVQALLEVSLLGTPLAQRRAAKILQWFKAEDEAGQPAPESSRGRAHSSGPRVEGDGGGGGTSSSRQDDGGGEDGREGKGCRGDTSVGKIVRQSLDRNMKCILRRATASVDLTNVKLLVSSSSSKSLPC